MQKPLVGSSFLRVEAKSKIRGTAKYIDDISHPNMLYGLTIRSPIAHGSIKSIDFDPKIPWDEFTIVTHEDIPGNNYIAHILNDQPCLIKSIINHVAEPILLIAHEDKHLLHRACEAIKIKIQDIDPILTISDSLSQKQNLWGKDNIFKTCQINKGKIEEGFKNADQIIEKEYQTGAQEHLYLENNSVIAAYNEASGITVWALCNAHIMSIMRWLTYFPFHPKKFE